MHDGDRQETGFSAMASNKCKGPQYTNEGTWSSEQRGCPAEGHVAQAINGTDKRQLNKTVRESRVKVYT